MARGMNERIQKLRELSVTTPVHIDLERARIETDFYRKNDGKYSIPVMRAMVLKEYFSKKTLYLGDGELIVGEKGKDPQASPTFPELCCHSKEDMVVMSERDLVSFHTTEEDREIQEKEIIPYWSGRSMRELSVTTPVHIDLERARIETDFYRKNDGKYSIPVMRAMVLKEYFSKKTLYLGDGELIVGEKGKDPQASPTFPELCCHSKEDMVVMSERDLVSFHTTEEDREIQEKEIIPYWSGRSMREKILAAMTPEWNDCYSAGMFTEFMEQRGPGHTCGGEQNFKVGYLEYKEKIKKTMDALDFMNDPEATDKMEELKAMDIACDAVIILGERYHKLALEMAEKEADPTRKKELEQIAANLEVVPAHKPQTFWQAIQLYWFTHLAVTTELNPWDAFSPGRLDQHLISYYEADTEAGILDDEKAKELLECLWIKFYNQPAPVKVGITLKESATYVDFANINTGGVTPDGKDGVNAVSYLILDCMDEMKLVQPNSNVTISKKTPARFLKRACEISRKGWGQPAFYNTEAQIMELVNAGKSLEDARRGGSSGCVETGA